MAIHNGTTALHLFNSNTFATSVALVEVCALLSAVVVEQLMNKLKISIIIGTILI